VTAYVNLCHGKGHHCTTFLCARALLREPRGTAAAAAAVAAVRARYGYGKRVAWLCDGTTFGNSGVIDGVAPGTFNYGASNALFIATRKRDADITLRTFVRFIDPLTDWIKHVIYVVAGDALFFTGYGTQYHDCTLESFVRGDDALRITRMPFRRDEIRQ